MANKIIIRMFDDEVSFQVLAKRTRLSVDTLKNIILSGEGQRTSEDNARAIAEALSARVSTLFVKQADGWYPRLRG